MKFLEVKNLKTFFHTRSGTVRAVDDISFSIERGEIVGVVGESGSGKSVTCHTLLGLLPQPPAKVEGGSIHFQGEDLVSLPKHALRALRGKRISMVFQDPMSCLNPFITIIDQVAEPLIIHDKLSRDEAEQQALEMMKKVGIRDAEKRARSFPHEFSGGMRQRVMIAMALVTKPDLLLADEPTTALDVTVQARILKILKSLREELDVSVLFITHDLGVVAEIADRIVVMYRGKIVEHGKVKEIFSNPKHPYVKGLLACRPTLDCKYEILPTVDDFLDTVEYEDGTVEIREKTDVESKLVRFVEEKRHPKIHTEPLVEVSNLSIHFRSTEGFFGRMNNEVRAVDGIDLTIRRGKTLGLVGESGCGKTTTGRAILHLIRPTKGEVLYDGISLGKLPMETLMEYRKKMQIIFQDPYASLNPRLTIEQALTEPMLVHKIGDSTSNRRERVVDLLEEVGLSSAHLLRYPHEFSGGQRQRICVARALAVQPEFIVCDECVSAMDVSVQAQVLNLLQKLQRKRQLTYLFISHDLSVVKFISDEVAVMKAGKVIESGIAEDLYANPKENYTRDLIDAIPSPYNLVQH
ncbi:MAG: ABC transporter ATP-binding protein [Opitutae bacterium]|nr:ABC transporter ATP-binding protein [Opitutae bacterium]MEC8421065.1 ABC transporter ATP-binding protein [Verrucomicrobiota bacterium]